MAVGYAQGDSVVQQPTQGPECPLNSESHMAPDLPVREKDAHAWPQVYFPILAGLSSNLLPQFVKSSPIW